MTLGRQPWLHAEPAPDPDDPLWSRAALDHGADLAVLGHRLRVRTNAPGLLALARETFGRFAPAGTDRPGLDLALIAGASAPVPASSAVGPPRHREHGGLFVADDGTGSLVAADLGGGRARAFIGPSARPEAVRAVVLEATAYRFVTWHGLTALHAAGLVVDGQSLVLRGAGGAGKTTLAYAAARAGHTVLADEVVWWDRADRCLRGTPWWLRLEPEATAVFPELDAVPPAARAQGGPKRVVDAAASGFRTIERAPAGPVVILEQTVRRPVASAWRRLRAHEARAAFQASLIVGERAQPASGLTAALEALLAERAYGLVAGAPDGAVAALEAIARDARSAAPS